MNSNPNYSDLTREQKEEFVNERMSAMKLRNAQLMQRHAEVEQDRIKAEERNSSITSISKVIPKKETHDYVLESNETKKKTEYAREWDRGKSDKDYWDSPDYHPSYNNHKSSHFERRERNANVRNYSRTENKLGGASEGFKNRSRRENYNYKKYDNSQQKSSSYYHHMGPKTGRDSGYQNNERCWKSKKTYTEEKYGEGDYKRSISKRSLNKTSSYACTSDSDSANFSNAKKPEKTSLWQNETLTHENKQIIVENWVTSVNVSNNLNQTVIPKENKEKNNIREKSYSKFDRFERSPNHSDDDDATSNNSNSFMHGNKVDASRNQVFHANRKIHKSSSNTNEQGYVKKPDKYSSQVHSGECNKNENFRKQRRFENREIKNCFKERFTGNKFNEPKPVANDSWNDADLPKHDKVGCHNDSNYHKSTAYNVDDDDGLWGSTEQSDIKWKLSDDESENYENVKKVLTPKYGLGKKVCSVKIPQQSKMAKPDDDKNQAYSDGGWSTVSEEGEIRDTEVQERRKKVHKKFF